MATQKIAYRIGSVTAYETVEVPSLPRLVWDSLWALAKEFRDWFAGIKAERARAGERWDGFPNVGTTRANEISISRGSWS